MFFSIVTFIGIPFFISLAYPKFKEAKNKLDGWSNKIPVYQKMRQEAFLKGFSFIYSQQLLDQKLVTPQETWEAWKDSLHDLKDTYKQPSAAAIRDFFEHSVLSKDHFNYVVYTLVPLIDSENRQDPTLKCLQIFKSLKSVYKTHANQADQLSKQIEQDIDAIKAHKSREIGRHLKEKEERIEQAEKIRDRAIAPIEEEYYENKMHLAGAALRNPSDSQAIARAQAELENLDRAYYSNPEVIQANLTYELEKSNAQTAYLNHTRPLLDNYRTEKARIKQREAKERAILDQALEQTLKEPLQALLNQIP